MPRVPTSPSRVPYGTIIRPIGVMVMAVAVVVVVGGWALDVSVLRSIVPGAVGMKAATAAGLFCAAGALMLLSDAGRSGAGLRWARALAAAPGLLGLLVLGEYVTGWSIGIDELPFTDHDGHARGIAHPGRFAPTTAVCFVLLSAALLTLDVGRARRWRPSELLVIPVTLAASASLIGYLYSIPTFYGPASAAKMAVNTALCFVALSYAVVLARPRGRLLELATTTDPGGILVRRLVPLAVLAPLALGWLHLRTVQWGWFDNEVGTWWATVGTIVVLGAMMWRVAAQLSRSDIERKLLEGKLNHLATRDQMTGLFNRHRFEDELKGFFARGARSGSPGALLVLDLDRMKHVNDELGHLAGDALLRGVADAMTERLRASDAVGRLGGDEFAVLLLDVDAADAERLAEELLERIRAIRVETARGVGWTTASIGVACVSVYTDPDGDRLMERADRAMYLAKQRGGDGVEQAEALDVSGAAAPH